MNQQTFEDILYLVFVSQKSHEILILNFSCEQQKEKKCLGTNT